MYDGRGIEGEGKKCGADMEFVWGGGGDRAGFLSSFIHRSLYARRSNIQDANALHTFFVLASNKRGIHVVRYAPACRRIGQL